MAQLPTNHPIVEAIYKWHESNQTDWRRPHLGGSMLGDECDRKLWYSFRWALPPEFNGRMLRLFETGQLEEARFVSELRGIGVTVWEVDPDTGQQIRIEMAGGHSGGSLDGIALDVPGSSKPHVVEMKTHNAKSFSDLKRHGVEKSKPMHYAQMQIYGYKMGIERFLYIAKNKDNDELYVERGHIKSSIGKALERRAEKIVFTDEPPERLSDDPSFYLCKFCQFSQTCHGNKAPTVTCRSCAFSTVKDDGTWHCEHHDKLLSIGDQKSACESHLFNPSMLRIKAIEFDPENHRVTYENGLVNGSGGFKSSDISAADDINFCNDEVLSVIDAFDGRVER